MHTGALEATLPAPRGSAYLQGFQLLATPTLPTQLIVVDSSRVNPSQARGWGLVAIPNSSHWIQPGAAGL